MSLSRRIFARVGLYPLDIALLIRVELSEVSDPLRHRKAARDPERLPETQSGIYVHVCGKMESDMSDRKRPIEAATRLHDQSVN